MLRQGLRRGGSLLGRRACHGAEVFAIGLRGRGTGGDDTGRVRDGLFPTTEGHGERKGRQDRTADGAYDDAPERLEGGRPGEGDGGSGRVEMFVTARGARVGVVVGV